MWKGDVNSTYKTYNILVDSTIKHTGNGTDLQADGSHLISSLDSGVQYTIEVKATDMNDAESLLQTSSKATSKFIMFIVHVYDITLNVTRLRKYPR